MVGAGGAFVYTEALTGGPPANFTYYFWDLS